MPNLHAHYYHGNLKAFRQELDGTAARSGAGGGEKGGVASGSGGGAASAGGGSLGKSWTLSSVGGVVKADPNERDWLGRTVLHIAAGSCTQQAWSFFILLLRNPHTLINLQDQESGYTALHRALFGGNIRAARELLARNECDHSIKDAEGMTAFELYNGTVDGTSPPQDVTGSDLFVWGVNRNFALGTGDSTDKAFPDRINLLTQRQASDHPDPAQRFFHTGVQDVVMSKLHTAVITDEARGNLSLCGFGSNGRLGRTIHSQLALTPMPDLPHKITQVALAQDHTLALTSGGYILSWGSNKFSQLGYPIEAPEKPVGLGKDESDVQVSPKRVVGPLKKEMVRGVATGRMSSACWTADTVWTWGTNTGHLGYEKSTNPVQVYPRKVTSLSQPVIDVALSDYAMVCLLDSFEVICFHGDTTFRVNFSTPRILSDAFPFRPPQSTLKPMIKKLTSCGSTFAALSSIGDVFTFSLFNPVDEGVKDGRDRHVTVKPQLIWALRKRFTAVKDVALGSDGTVIICTHAGHVYVRQRSKAGAGGLKFKHIPYLQRVIKVATNESGAFAAIRIDAKPRHIHLAGKTLEEDLVLLQPHFQRYQHQMTAEDFDHGPVRLEEDEEDEGSNSVTKDLQLAFKLCTILRRWRSSETDTLFSWSESLMGSDMFFVVKGLAIPAHRMIVDLRVPALQRLSAGQRMGKFAIDKRNPDAVVVDVCHPLVVLLLLQYVYSDDVAALWDSRVTRAAQEKFADLKLPFAQIKLDLRALADSLDLKPLSTVLDSTAKTPIPTRTLPTDVQTFFTQTYSSPSPSTDITLVLADKDVACSSIILRARCPFFGSMFADSDWTAARQEGEGRMTVQMRHLKWRPMRLVFRYLHEGCEDDLFDYLHQETLDEFLDFVFEVLAAATELLLDRLVLVCSRVIIRHCNAYNAASLACEANFYQAAALKDSIFAYILSSMETMLESGLLDDMDEETMADLVKTVEIAQKTKLPVPRLGLLTQEAMSRQKDWLALQDIPIPRVRERIRWKPRSPALSPLDPFQPALHGKRGTMLSPLNSPEVLPQTSSKVSGGVDDIFAMDDDPSSPPTTTSGRQTPRSSRPMTPLDLASVSSRGAGAAPSTASGPVWRSAAVDSQKADLRSIMAETAAIKTPSRPTAPRQTTPSTLMGTSTPERRHPIPGSMGSPSAGGMAQVKSPVLARSPPSSSSAATSAWRPVEARKTSFTTVQSQQSPQSTSTAKFPPALGQATLSRAPATSSSIPGGLSTSGITANRPASGPALTPRKSSGPAWSTPTAPSPSALPPLSPPSMSAAAAGPSQSQSFSLLAIQQQELDLAGRSTKQPTKSLTQIQQEERDAAEAQAKEAEFMRWWEEEQARVKQAAKTEASGTGGGSRGGGRGRGVGAAANAVGGGRGQARRVPPTRGGHSARGGEGKKPGRGGLARAASTMEPDAADGLRQTDWSSAATGSALHTTTTSLSATAVAFEPQTTLSHGQQPQHSSGTPTRSRGGHAGRGGRGRSAS